jgi:acyl carrier protein
MTRDDITAVLVDELGRIAPEIDATGLDADADLREELDIDSMDFLNLVTGVGQRFKIDIPETDYLNLTTLRQAVAYLAQKRCAALMLTASALASPLIQINERSG